MRAHCPNYNEASYFFRAERSRSICPRQRRLDDSGPGPGPGPELSARLGSDTKCKRIVGTWPSSRNRQNERDRGRREKDKARREEWRGVERSGEERRGEERTVGFSAGTSQFSQPFMLPTDFFALFSRLIHTSPHEIRSSIPTCIISQHTGESSFPALALCRPFHAPVCMRRALLDLSHSFSSFSRLVNHL